MPSSKNSMKYWYPTINNESPPLEILKHQTGLSNCEKGYSSIDIGRCGVSAWNETTNSPSK